jgi:hypothetical protein
MSRIENHRAVYVGDLVAPANGRFNQDSLEAFFTRHGLKTMLLGCLVREDPYGHPYIIFKFRSEGSARSAKALLGEHEFRNCFNHGRHVTVRFGLKPRKATTEVPLESMPLLATLAISSNPPDDATSRPSSSTTVLRPPRRWEATGPNRDAPVPHPKLASIVSAGVNPPGSGDNLWGDNMLVSEAIPTFSPQPVTGLDYGPFQFPVQCPVIPTIRIAIYDGASGVCVRIFDLPMTHFPAIDASLAELCQSSSLSFNGV